MKNIQIIDGATNSTFEIHAISDGLFRRLFPKGANIAFADDFEDNFPGAEELWLHLIEKRRVKGIHGTLHLSLSDGDPRWFPSRRGERCRQKQKGRKNLSHAKGAKG